MKDIEEVRKNDLAEILDLQKIAFKEVAEKLSSFTISPMMQTYESIVEEYKTHLFLKYCVADKIVGSVRANLDDANICHIGKLIVHPDYQNKGIGKALMKEIESRFADCTKYELFTGSETKNTIHLYKKLEYIETSVKEINTLSLVFMEKNNKIKKMYHDHTR